MKSNALKKMNRLLNRTVVPVLRNHGFRANRPREFVRERDQFFQVYNFRNFTAGMADRLNITTASFSVDMSIHCPFIPGYFRELVNGKYEDLATNYIVTMPILKDIHQPEVQARRDDVWFVSDDESNIDVCVQSLLRVTEKQALPWFDRIDTLSDVLMLVQSPESAPYLGLFGQGKANSPHNDYLLGYIFYQLGDLKSAQKHFKQIIEGSLENMKTQHIYEILAEIKAKNSLE